MESERENSCEDWEPKEKFINWWHDGGLDKRDGGADLLEWLEEKRFFDLPASINHHLNYSGGLCEHTVNVVENAVELCNTNHAFECCDQEAVIVAALLHDICKANKYLSDGIGYHYQDTGMLGHGEESVIFAQKFVKLTDREIMAIRWHMGAYSGEKDWNTLGKVYDQYPEAICLHLADMIATHYDER